MNSFKGKWMLLTALIAMIVCCMGSALLFVNAEEQATEPVAVWTEDFEDAESELFDFATSGNCLGNLTTDSISGSQSGRLQCVAGYVPGMTTKVTFESDMVYTMQFKLKSDMLNSAEKKFIFGNFGNGWVPGIWFTLNGSVSATTPNGADVHGEIQYVNGVYTLKFEFKTPVDASAFKIDLASAAGLLSWDGRDELVIDDVRIFKAKHEDVPQYTDLPAEEVPEVAAEKVIYEERFDGKTAPAGFINYDDIGYEIVNQNHLNGFGSLYSKEGAQQFEIFGYTNGVVFKKGIDYTIAFRFRADNEKIAYVAAKDADGEVNYFWGVNNGGKQDIQNGGASEFTVTEEGDGIYYAELKFNVGSKATGKYYFEFGCWEAGCRIMLDDFRVYEGQGDIGADIAINVIDVTKAGKLMWTTNYESIANPEATPDLISQYFQNANQGDVQPLSGGEQINGYHSMSGEALNDDFASFGFTRTTGSFATILRSNQIYTLQFRMKVLTPLADMDGFYYMIAKTMSDASKNIVLDIRKDFTAGANMSTFETGLIDYQIIDNDTYLEVRATIFTGSFEDYYFEIGASKKCKIAIDDIRCFEGGLAVDYESEPEVLVPVEPEISDNANITSVIYDGQTLSEGDIVDLPAGTTELDFKKLEIILEDDYSDYQISGYKDLKAGENTVTITVTAEDGVTTKTFTFIAKVAQNSGCGASAEYVSVGAAAVMLLGAVAVVCLKKKSVR